MTTQDRIIEAVLMGRCTSGCWADTFIKQEKGGDNISCCMTKLKLLIVWIEILEKYYCDIYTLLLDESCLTEDEAVELSAKVKKLIRA